MKKIILLILLIIAVPAVVSLEGKMPLLAVRETSEGFKGSRAELFLEVKEGTGRVFVDTFPLSKVDTQISMRFAKEIACDFLEKNCDSHDFIYTIRANAPIIGGPSAGAAASILTVSVLSQTPLDQRKAITGTINSGGIIGPVGGIKEKIEAAASDGLTHVLIPLGESSTANESVNETVNLTQLGEEKGISIIEVVDLNEALKAFTGKTFQQDDQQIQTTSSYQQTMKNLAVELCDRNQKLRSSIVFTNDTQGLFELSTNLSNRGNDAFESSEYYSAASFCFGSNVRINQAFLESKNFSAEKYQGLFEELKREIRSFEEQIESLPIKTITDLESYMIVKERLVEALQYTNNSNNNSLAYAYAYGNERLHSAYSWSKFFNHQGRNLVLDEESLKESCRQKIAEGEERLQYASIYLPFSLQSPREELDLAYTDFNSEDYAACLFKSSKAKAEANIVLNTLGVQNSFIPILIDTKLTAAGRVIQKAEQKDMFPILGYSYYEYANSLKESDQFSALLYSEYALELSNLDLYFREKESPVQSMKIDKEKMMFIILGILIGVASAIPFIRYSQKPKVKKKKKAKRRKPSKA